MKAIYKRELRSYFNSMIGYVYVAVVTALIGIFFMAINLYSGYPYFGYALTSILIIFTFTIPILSMKSLAEERRQKTDQMLLTYPVSVSSVVMGKYLAMATVFALPLLISCLCPIIIILSGGTGSFLIDYSTIFAVFCMGLMFIAIGMFISSLTESQVIAAIVSISFLLLIYFWANLVGFIPETAAISLVGLFVILAAASLIAYRLTRNKLIALIVAVAGAAALIATYLTGSDRFAGLLPNILGVFSVTDVINNFVSYYVFDVGGLFFFLSVSALFVFLTVQSIQKRRWS